MCKKEKATEIKKVLYLGEAPETEERLKTIFSTVKLLNTEKKPVELNTKDSGKTWPMYSFTPENAEALIIDSNDEEVVREGIEYVACFSIPVVIRTSHKVLGKIMPHLMWLTGDNRIFVLDCISSSEFLEKVVAFTVTAPYNAGVIRCISIYTEA